MKGENTNKKRKQKVTNGSSKHLRQCLRIGGAFAREGRWVLFPPSLLIRSRWIIVKDKPLQDLSRIRVPTKHRILKTCHPPPCHGKFGGTGTPDNYPRGHLQHLQFSRGVTTSRVGGQLPGEGRQHQDLGFSMSASYAFANMFVSGNTGGKHSTAEIPQLLCFGPSCGVYRNCMRAITRCPHNNTIAERIGGGGLEEGSFSTFLLFTFLQLITINSQLIDYH